MLYESTRGKTDPVTSAQAIKMGIAPDGGLFVPVEPGQLACRELTKKSSYSYTTLARVIMEHFLTDFSVEEIKQCVFCAYNNEKFDHPAITPLTKLDRELYTLELWHGPTYAFKDLALQILPHLLTRSVGKTGGAEKIAILVATSGDTGKAALEGFKDVPGVKIIVFFPEEGVSEIQKRQMITQEGGNVYVVAVRGNFDQAQNGVKEIFGDRALNREIRHRGYLFSSANSINWGRLLPQITYYFFAYLDLLAKNELTAGENINFVVPSGNFGNILAAFYAQQMGLPVHRLVLAANKNNVLHDFIRTGVYDRNRPFHRSISPSMDILISSNLERLLFTCTGKNSGKVTIWMKELREKGRYFVDRTAHAIISKLFWSDYSDENETLAAIRDTYQRYGYLIDTHTAVGMDVYRKYIRATGDHRKTVVVSTASPFKFNKSVIQAIWGEAVTRQKNEFALLELLAQKTGLSIPSGLKDLDKKPALHTLTVEPADMSKTVRKILSASSV